MKKQLLAFSLIGGFLIAIVDGSVSFSNASIATDSINIGNDIAFPNMSPDIIFSNKYPAHRISKVGNSSHNIDEIGKAPSDRCLGCGAGGSSVPRGKTMGEIAEHQGESGLESQREGGGDGDSDPYSRD